MHRRRRVDLKRSKRGCMTCRVRRKKCPEDFQQWPDGSYGCSTCSHRGQPCELPRLTVLSGSNSSGGSSNNSNAIISGGGDGGGRGGIGRTMSSNSIPSSHFGRTGSLISSSSSMSLDHESGTPISSISASPSLANRQKPPSMQPPPSPHQHQHHPRYSESSSSGIMGPPYSHTKAQTPIEFLSPAEILRRADSTMPSFSYPHQRSSSSTTSSSRPQATSLLHPPSRTGSEVTLAKSPAQSGLDQDSSTRNWLDTFFGEFMQLTEPSLQKIQDASTSQVDQHSLAFSPTEVGPIAGGPDASHPSYRLQRSGSGSMTVPAPTSHSDPSPANSMSSPAFPWSDSAIDQAVRLDDLDELLIRWSPIYETYLGAIVDDSKRSDGGSLLDQLMEITKSCNICKASMVACCLAYRDLIARELQSTRPISRIVKYLLGSETQNIPTTTGTSASTTAKDTFNKSNNNNNNNNNKKGSTPSVNSTDSGSKSSATYASRYAHAWLKFALDGFNRISATMPLATKMLSLLNIRYSTICLQGGREMVPLMNELQMLMAEISVDVGYLYNTCNSGTTLAFMAQALAFANVMDHAALSGVRPAVANKCHSAVLTEDAMTRPHATYQYMTALSVGLLECIKRITDLSADIKGGLVYDRADIEARSEQIKTLILSSEITLPSDLGKANSRMRTFGLHELWRQAVLIQLYQDVHHLGPMASRLQEVLSQMFILTEILSTTERDTERGSDRADVWDMSYVYFLACTVAVKDQHRSVFLGHLESLGCEKAILDNVDCVKTLWRVMDETGRATDWREVMADNDLYPCYTF